VALATASTEGVSPLQLEPSVATSQTDSASPRPMPQMQKG